MKLYLTKITAFLIGIFLFTACNHETDSFDGPSLIDRFGPFDVLANIQASQSTVDFVEGETVFFTAEFNKNVNWIIEIKGTESEAIKRIHGFNRIIDQSNSTWDGGTSELPFFINEICQVSLTVPEEPDYISNTEVETLSAKSYEDEGVLFANFEQDYGVDLFVGNFEFEFTDQTGYNTELSPQGQNCYLLQGTDNVVPNFFVGLIDIKSNITGNTYVELPTTVPEELYFNALLYSPISPHGLGIIDFIVDSNDSGDFEDGEDSTYRVEDYDLATWEGWRLISHPMSNTGITQAELEKIVGIRLLLISNMNSQPNPPLQVEFGIDFMIFTDGAPLEL